MDASERERLIEQYAAGPAGFRAAVAAVSAEALSWRPAPNEFSAHEVAVHCADSETNAHARLRYLLAEKDPVIFGYDPMHWATEFDYAAHPLDVALATIDAVRANTAALLRRLPDAAWTKEGRHTESGRYTAEDWLRIYAQHLEEHTEQVQRAAAAWRPRE